MSSFPFPVPFLSTNMLFVKWTEGSLYFIIFCLCCHVGWTWVYWAMEKLYEYLGETPINRLTLGEICNRHSTRHIALLNMIEHTGKLKVTAPVHWADVIPTLQDPLIVTIQLSFWIGWKAAVKCSFQKNSYCSATNGN